ncbi:MAG: glycosyltransferase, partial [Gammaproteobacteria bacterium]
MHRLVEGLAAGRPCTVIGPRGARAHLPASVRLIELPHRPAVLFVGLAWVLVGMLCLRERFGAVLAGNGLMRLAAATPLRRCPVVTMVYGLDIIAPHALYQALCLPLIARSAAVIACSSNSARMAAERGVPAERLHAVTPGVDMPAGPAARDASHTGGPLIVSVGRLVRRKGIAEFVGRALPGILQRFPSARFLVIGEDPAAALKREGSESARIRHAAEEAGVQSKVELAGYLDDA